MVTIQNKVNQPEDLKPRYSVDWCLRESDNKRFFIVLDNGIPARTINLQLLREQQQRHQRTSSNTYILCAFLNCLDSDGIDPKDVTIDYLESYFTQLSIEAGKSADTIKAHIRVVANLYENLALRNVALHPSLLRTRNDTVIIAKTRGSLTTIPDFGKHFKSRKDVSANSVYTKWYTDEQIDAIASNMQLVDRCIFLDTVFTGHRIDSALSICLDDFDPQNQTIYARHTKTRKTHVAPIPMSLVNLINTYIIEERSRIVERTGTTSNALFLNPDGKQRTYSAYYAAIKRTEKKLKENKPELGITSLHTHAGRSTFLATLRSYQLEQRRKGLPTFSDADILTLMDWKSMDCLENYDLLTRAFEVLPFQRDFFQEHYSYLIENKTWSAG